MNLYVTHQFAHVETLDRADRWLRQRGFPAGQIETHREGLPWIAVVCPAARSAEVALIFDAAERSDPDGWPSFWELARMPHTRVSPALDMPIPHEHGPRPFPLGWHPIDMHLGGEDISRLKGLWGLSNGID